MKSKKNPCYKGKNWFGETWEHIWVYWETNCKVNRRECERCGKRELLFGYYDNGAEDWRRAKRELLFGYYDNGAEDWRRAK